MGQREELLAAVRARLERAAAGDATAIREAPAMAEAHRLARFVNGPLDPDDAETERILGWFHYRRTEILPQPVAGQDKEAALRFFTRCFIAGIDDLPQPLLATLAGRAVSYAIDLGERASRTPTDRALRASAVGLWERIMGTPGDQVKRALLSHGVSSLSVQYAKGRLERIKVAVQASPNDHPNPTPDLTNQGISLRERFQRTQEPEDLDQAVEVFRAAVRATPRDRSDRDVPLACLGEALEARFKLTGNAKDLDQAVQLFAASARAIPRKGPEHAENLPVLASYLTALGRTLQARSQRTGNVWDLDQAVTAYRAAVAALPPDHSERARYLTTLGTALHARTSKRSEQAKDLDQAVEALRAAVAALPPNHPDPANILLMLGIVLGTRFQRTGNLMDLDQAVVAARSAVRAATHNHPLHNVCLTQLGAVLEIRYDHSGDVKELDEAVEVHRAAVRATLYDDFHRAMSLSGLAGTLQLRFEHTGESADREEALSLWGQAVEAETGPPSLRIAVARRAARFASSSDPGRAAGFLERAVLMLPELAPRWLDRDEQQHALGRRAAGLVGDAAARVLGDTNGNEQGRAMRALRLIEAGRGVLLSQALDTRSDLTDLKLQHPDLARRFTELRELLDQDPAVAATGVGADPSGRTGSGRHRLGVELEELLRRIRACDGFAAFALPPTPDELLAEAAHGPVVTFNVNRYRSDALLLTRNGITSCPLPGLSQDTVIDQLNTFYGALADATAPDCDRIAAQQTLRRTLEWLWEAAAEPVLSALAALGEIVPPTQDGAPLPRVWWAPGAILDLLPLHAAGFHTDPVHDPNRRTVMDRVISSYTPTIRALRHARGRRPRPASGSQSLIVAMPTTPGHSPLPYASEEVRQIRALLHCPIQLTEPAPAPDGTPAPPGIGTPTTATVLAHLPQCGIAHFACHGNNRSTDQSELLLHDHATTPLTVSTLSQISLDHAHLAYLSACSTANPGTTDFLDEAIHLTSAFQLAGFPHVIGTLWPINDRLAVEVAESFYIHLTIGPRGTLDPSQAATALHHTIRALRDRYPATPSLWAAYLHAGA